LVKTNRYTKT